MYQIVQQTREEKIAMYRKMKKKALAEMLVNCNDLIDTLTLSKTITIENPPITISDIDSSVTYSTNDQATFT